MNLKSIFTIQKLYITFEILGFSMLLPFLIRYFSNIEILRGYMILFITPLILIFFCKKIISKKFIIFAFILRFISMAIFLVKPALVFMYLFFFLAGLVTFFFWVPYNIRYFKFSHKMNRATSAGHFIIVGPILNSFIPLISALIIKNYNYHILILISSAVFLILFFKTLRINELKINYSFYDSFLKAKGIRTLKFFQGIWEAGNIMIPLCSLLFIKDELSFGGFLSYLGVVGIIATFFITRLSDKHQKRLKYFIPFLCFLALSTLSLSFADSFSKWILTVTLVGTASTLTYPFFFATVLDKIEDKSIAMITREFMLNIGRFFGIFFVLILVHLGLELRKVYIFFGLSLVAYMFLIFTKKVYFEEAYYPLSPIVKMYGKGKGLRRFFNKIK